MKKRCKEENIDLKIEFAIIKIILLALFLSEEIFSQIPINGFCRYKKFPIEQNLNNLTALNYNDDSYTDLILYNPGLKKIVSLPGKSNGSFGKPLVSKIPLPITSIQSLIEENKSVKKYAFTSRQNYKVGILSFRKNGRAILTSSIKFKSYPDNICTADINHNGKDEILVSGTAFNGLSIIYQEHRRFKAKKIAAKTSFSQAVFTDLNNDDFSDIAAFNVLKNDLVFFYNDGVGRFSKVRTIKMDQSISSLHAVDMNLDSYSDLLFVKSKSINIMYGDFSSSYDTVVTIPTHYFPDEIITGDFNRDGKIDIAYINREEGILSIIYSKGEKSFYPEMIYLQKNMISNLIPFYSKFINGIALISPDGNLYTITNLETISDNTNISLGAKPSAINYFDYGNNGIYDICYIDNFTKTLDFIVRNSAGTPKLFYSYPLLNVHEKIIADDTAPWTKIFFCFTPGKSLIEVLKINFRQNKYERHIVYSPGKIEDLKIMPVRKNYDNIYVSYLKNGLLGLCIMEFRNYRYAFTNFSNLAGKIYGSNVTLQNGPGVIFWNNNNNKLISLQRIIIGNRISSNKTLYSLNYIDSISVYPYTADFLNNGKETTISFFYGSKNFIIVTRNRNNFKIKESEFAGNYKIDSLNQLFFGKSGTGRSKKLFVYLPGKSVILRLDFLNYGKNLSPTKIISTGNINSYFIKNMSFNHFYLVYTDRLDNCIKIKQL